MKFIVLKLLDGIKILALGLAIVMLHSSLLLRRVCMGHKSGQCKTPGCNKDQWRDGYCRNCAQYAIQKATIDGLQSTANLLLQVAEGLKRVEDKVQNLQPQIIESKHEKVIIKEKPIVIESNVNEPQPTKPKIKKKQIFDDVDFIPTIHTSTAIPQIRDTKSSTVNKDLNRIADKLSKTNVGG